jgi:hypothetical protein
MIMGRSIVEQWISTDPHLCYQSALPVLPVIFIDSRSGQPSLDTSVERAVFYHGKVAPPAAPGYNNSEGKRQKAKTSARLLVLLSTALNSRSFNFAFCLLPFALICYDFGRVELELKSKPSDRPRRNRSFRPDAEPIARTRAGD